jgi:(p)ppGpp synthase/HD superfamily hydrolase
MEYLTPTILEALEFAALAHQGQFRKSPTHIPYFSHPAAVALILAKGGFPEEVVVAGILHDVIEDTPFTAEDIEKRFGKKVLGIVLGVTEDKSLKWEERNRAYNEHLKNGPVESIAVSAADLIANRKSVVGALKKGDNPWVNFSKKPKDYAAKRLYFDSERIRIIKERLDHSIVRELEKIDAETVRLTKNLQW